MMSLPLAHGIAASVLSHNSPLASSRARCIIAAKPPVQVLPLAKPVIYAHKLVRDTAVSMAHELYDAMMMQDAWWKEWQRLNPGVSRHTLEQRFVNKNLPLLVPQARAALAKCLQPGQCPSMDETQRQEVLQALILDNQLVDSRTAASRASRERIRVN
jgi:hypothetical protein